MPLNHTLQVVLAELENKVLGHLTIISLCVEYVLDLNAVLTLFDHLKNFILARNVLTSFGGSFERHCSLAVVIIGFEYIT